MRLQKCEDERTAYKNPTHLNVRRILMPVSVLVLLITVFSFRPLLHAAYWVASLTAFHRILNIFIFTHF